MFDTNCVFPLMLLLSRCNGNVTPNITLGELWTTGVINWNQISANMPVMVKFDNFSPAKCVGKSDDNTALVVKRSGCYYLDYLVNISNFVAAGTSPAYNGIEVYMAVNGNPVSSPVKLDPTGSLSGRVTSVATDKIESVWLNRCDKISLMLRASANGTSMTVTPSAWLDAAYLGG
ncbi:MAG: hypothetical protein FWC60_09575 [Firmicutes bacterium]|nr:hypothetical protein [Bacillota bacterium]